MQEQQCCRDEKYQEWRQKYLYPKNDLNNDSQKLAHNRSMTGND